MNIPSLSRTAGQRPPAALAAMDRAPLPGPVDFPRLGSRWLAVTRFVNRHRRCFFNLVNRVAPGAVGLVALSVIALSCGDGELPGGETSGGPIRLDARVEGLPGGQSRVATDEAFKSTWEDGDVVGVYAVKREKGGVATLQPSGNYMDNVPFRYDGNGWEAAGECWWPKDGEVLDFYAYYPYSTRTTDARQVAFAVATDQSSNEGKDYNRSDLLVAPASSGSEGKLPGETVTLTFRHALSLVEVKVEPGTVGLPSSATLRGFRTGGTVDLSTGDFTVDPGGAVTPVRMWRLEKTGSAAFNSVFTCRALVPAQQVAAGTIPYEVYRSENNYPAPALSSPLTLVAGRVKRFNPVLSSRAPGIGTAAELEEFSSDWNAAGSDAAKQARVIAKWSVDGSPTGTIYLRANIDMAGRANFTPIGVDAGNAFTGTLDGDTYTISNLTVNKVGNHAGLFGWNNGTIRNVVMKGCHVTGNGWNVGCVVGYNNKQGAIAGCVVTGCTVENGGNDCGSIAGYIVDGSITGCTVTNCTLKSGAKCGGIVGYSNGLVTIRDCVVTGCTITADGECSGGIAGYSDKGGVLATCRVVDCTITAGSYSGGIAGRSVSRSPITGCVVTGGTVMSGKAPDWGNYSGGITGYNDDNSPITGCLVTGCEVIVNNGNYSGGITGYNEGVITACVAVPTRVRGGGGAKIGILAGYNKRGSTLSTCHGVNIGNQVGEDKGETLDCGSFDRSAVVQGAGNFFTTPVEGQTPIERMNEALEKIGASVRWRAGDAASGRRGERVAPGDN